MLSLPINRTEIILLEFYFIFRDPINKIIKVKMNLPCNYTALQLAELLKTKVQSEKCIIKLFSLENLKITPKSCISDNTTI